MRFGTAELSMLAASLGASPRKVCGEGGKEIEPMLLEPMKPESECRVRTHHELQLFRICPLQASPVCRPSRPDFDAVRIIGPKAERPVPVRGNSPQRRSLEAAREVRVRNSM